MGRLHRAEPHLAPAPAATRGNNNRGCTGRRRPVGREEEGVLIVHGRQAGGAAVPRRQRFQLVGLVHPGVRQPRGRRRKRRRRSKPRGRRKGAGRPQPLALHAEGRGVVPVVSVVVVVVAESREGTAAPRFQSCRRRAVRLCSCYCGLSPSGGTGRRRRVLARP